MLGQDRARRTKTSTAPGTRNDKEPGALFDWHGGTITRATPVTGTYRNTQNVRRFLRTECGADFKFDRAFMRWITDGTAKTMGQVADQWLMRRSGGRR